MHRFYFQDYSSMFIYQAQGTENPEGPIPQFQTPSTTNSNPKNFIQEPKLKTPTPESAINEKKRANW